MKSIYAYFLIFFVFFNCTENLNPNENIDDTITYVFENTNSENKVDTIQLISENTLQEKTRLDFRDSILNLPPQDLILECPDRFKNELISDIKYLKKKWENTPNPIIVQYLGNDIGDYFHLNFKSKNEEYFDFGVGANEFGKYSLYTDSGHYEDNPKYVNQWFRIYWEWKISKFPCCSGEYNWVKAYQPSIISLELLE